MSDGSVPEDPTGYFQEASRWDSDRIASLVRMARIAWRVAVGGWLCALGCTGALLLLTPLKRTEPFLIRVDSSTGVVDVVPVYAGTAAFDESVSRYFLSHYVTVCERFNYSTAESDYEECGAFHGPQRNQAWYATWRTSNPNSPLNLHRDGSLVRAQVQSVSFFRRASGAGDLAQVRYLKSESPPGGAPARISHWIATVQYAYGTPPKDPKLRRWNPLGFRVVEFTTEPEVGTEVPAASAGTTGTAAP